MAQLKPIHKRLENVAKTLPCKVIEVDGEPYIERYYVGTTDDGKADLWLHHILKPDLRHLHNHPFKADITVLSGGYLEEKVDRAVWRSPPKATYHHSTLDILEELVGCIEKGNVERLAGHIAASHCTTPLDFHRIARLDKNSPTWTLLEVDYRRLPFWYFKEPGQPYQTMNASPRDWWRAYL